MTVPVHLIRLPGGGDQQSSEDTGPNLEASQGRLSRRIQGEELGVANPGRWEGAKLNMAELWGERPEA